MFLLLAFAASAQAVSQPLEPSEQWKLSAQDVGCTVERSYGSDRTTVVGLQTTMQSRPAFLIIQGSKRLLPSRIGEVRLTLDGSDTLVVHYGAFETANASIRLVKLFPDEKAMARISTAALISVGDKMPPLRVGGIGAAIGAVDRCTSEKLTSFGVDPRAYLERKTASLTGSFAAMFGANNYPREAKAKGASGKVVVLLKADDNGAITSCKVVASPDKSLDVGTCDVAKRGRLQPPLDTTGKPMASYAVIPINWTHP